MFEVTAVRGWLPSKLVELTVLEEVNGIKIFLTGLRGRVYRCPYHFGVGEKLIVEFPPWKRINVGDRIETSTVLKQPSVERMIFRNRSSWL